MSSSWQLDLATFDDARLAQPLPVQTPLSPDATICDAFLGTIARSFPRMTKKSPRRVLIVDDESLIRWALAETFGDHGYAVTEAENAQAARIAASSCPSLDVVLLDFMLPDSNDLSLLADIRRLAPGACVIMMTAYETPEMVLKARNLGALRVVNKPFEVADILALTDTALGGRPT